MNVRTFTAYWAIERDPRWTTPEYLDRGGVAYERDGRCHLIYSSELSQSGLNGEWIKFTDGLLPGASPEDEDGPVSVDRNYGSGGLATYLEALKVRVEATVDLLAEFAWASGDDLLGPILMDL
jgi:hypothetical protein